MLGQDYFQTRLPAQQTEIAADGASCGTFVHLHDGTIYLVRAIENAQQDYVMLTVYPDEVFDADDVEDLREELVARQAGGSGPVLFDKVAIPYGSISRVVVTRKDLGFRTKFGFAAIEGLVAKQSEQA